MWYKKRTNYYAVFNHSSAETMSSLEYWVETFKNLRLWYEIDFKFCLCPLPQEISKNSPHQSFLEVLLKKMKWNFLQFLLTLQPPLHALKFGLILSHKILQKSKREIYWKGGFWREVLKKRKWAIFYEVCYCTYTLCFCLLIAFMIKWVPR